MRKFVVPTLSFIRTSKPEILAGCLQFFQTSAAELLLTCPFNLFGRG